MIFVPWNWSFNIYNRTNVLHENNFQAKLLLREFYIQQAAAGLMGEWSALQSWVQALQLIKGEACMKAMSSL